MADKQKNTLSYRSNNRSLQYKYIPVCCSSTPGINVYLPQRLKEVKAQHWKVIKPKHGFMCFICSSRKNTDTLSTKLKIKSRYWHSCFDPTQILSEDEWSQCTAITRLIKSSQSKPSLHFYSTRVDFIFCSANTAVIGVYHWVLKVIYTVCIYVCVFSNRLLCFTWTFTLVLPVQCTHLLS